ncbi:MAG: thioredoxin family protein [Verrucomicrobiaceae bacterium]
MNTLTIFTSLSLVLSSVAAAHCPAHEIAAARTKAAEQKKDVLLIFTGGDWHSTSKMFKEGVLDQEAFKKASGKNFVVQSFEFPKEQKETSKELNELREQFAIRRLPTLVLTDALGRPFGSTSFGPGGLEKILADFDKSIAKRVKRDEGFAKAEKAKGVDRAKALVEGLEQVAQGDLRKFYENELKAVKEADPKGETGFIAKLEKDEALQKERAHYQELFQAQKLDEIVKQGREAAAGAKGEDAQRFSMYVIQALVSQKKYDEAKKQIAEMVKLDEKTEMGKSAERFNSIVDRIRERDEKQAQMAAEAAKRPKVEKKPAGPIVSKPVAVVTDIKKLHEEAKELEANAAKAAKASEEAQKELKGAAERVTKLEKELEGQRKAQKKAAEKAEKAKADHERLAKRSQAMKDVIENHEAMERRKREIGELEKKAAALQEEAKKLREQAENIKKGRK